MANTQNYSENDFDITQITIINIHILWASVGRRGGMAINADDSDGGCCNSARPMSTHDDDAEFRMLYKFGLEAQGSKPEKKQKQKKKQHGDIIK